MSDLSTVSAPMTSGLGPPDSDAATTPPLRRRAHKLAHELVEDLGGKIRSQALTPGDKLPTESEIMQAFGVSRTVVREALSKLQAAGLVETRHGIGTFVLAPRVGAAFTIEPVDVAAAVDVLAVLEFRISLETESAGLAAQRRTPAQLALMRAALDDFGHHVVDDGDTVSPDFRFHLQVAFATGNRYFGDILSHLGTTIIPRTRVQAHRVDSEPQTLYLQRVNREHEEIYSAIERRDPEAARAAMRIHLANSRERMRRAQMAAEEARAPHEPGVAST